METYVYPRGSIERKQTVSFWIKAWQAIGGQAANSSGALKYLLKQVEEVASNRDSQPVYIEWTTTADGTALYTSSEAHDGWYVIDDFEPNYQKNVVMGICECRMTVTEVAPPAPHGIAMGYTGGALSSTYSGVATNLLSLPVGSTALEASFNRTGAEGAIPCILSPVASPEPFVPGTVTQLLDGQVHVYDTLNTGSNPVPVTGGTFVHANWVEVFYTDHYFVGDCVITNGLLLLLFVAGGSGVCTVYLWNTALATANWQSCNALQYLDNAGSAVGTLRAYTLSRLGGEECAITTTNGALSQVSRITIRLQRGRYDGRVDFQPLTQSNAGNYGLAFPPGTGVQFTSTNVLDTRLTAERSKTGLAAADYGYGGLFNPGTGTPFICGLLWQNPPANQLYNDGNRAYFGDTSGPTVGASRSYGFFAIPYGSSGVYSTANLQAEAESGTLGTGWTSQAGAGGNSNALEAKCASGTVATNADTFGTAFVPAVANYDVWFRVKVTTNVGSALEMTLGLWDNDTGAFVASGSTTFNRTAMTTSYAWYRAAVGVVPPATKNMRFRAVTALTLGTDWFIDEAVMFPTANLAGGSMSPQQIWLQFMYDRSVRLVRS